jgi:polyisoprenoid-binding protein YceI
MLGSNLLDAAEHESIRIESSRIGGEFPNLEVTAGVTVKGTQHELQLPVSVNTFDRGLVAVGRIRISHADIGLRPFKAGLGTLRVADELQVKFRVVATK